MPSGTEYVVPGWWLIISLGTVKSRLSRARQMLRERLASMQDVLVAA